MWYGVWRNEPHGLNQIHNTLRSSRFTIFQTSITIEFIMRLTALLLGGLFGSLTQSADAVTTFRGTRTYLTILNTNIKYPLFSKEFKEADGIISVGGNKDATPEVVAAVHLPVGYRQATRAPLAV